MKTKYPHPICDEACYYHCTKGGQQEPECVTNNPDMEFNQDYEDQQREADEIINNQMEF